MAESNLISTRFLTDGDQPRRHAEVVRLQHPGVLTGRCLTTTLLSSGLLAQADSRTNLAPGLCPALLSSPSLQGSWRRKLLHSLSLRNCEPLARNIAFTQSHSLSILFFLFFFLILFVIPSYLTSNQGSEW